MSSPTLETYLTCLGKLAVTVKVLSEEQNVYIRSGVLDDDEIELAETIKWECSKLIRFLDSQVRNVGDRSSVSWDETLEKITNQIIGEMENGTNKSEGNKNKGN